jgi:hypothetical protein
MLSIRPFLPSALMVFCALSLSSCGQTERSAEVAPAKVEAKGQTERSVEIAPTKVETKTYDANGKQVTERTITTTVRETESTARRRYKAAIFVTNRAGSRHDDKLAVLEDFLSAQVADLGFTIISRELAVDSMRKFDPATASAPRPADSLDAKLTDQSSALRFAQNLGVDYLLHASITSVETRNQDTKAYGVQFVDRETTLKVNYKIAEAVSGGALTGETIRVSASEQRTANSASARNGLVSDLLDEAAQKITASLGRRVAENRITPPSAGVGFVTLTIQTEAADLLIPDVRLGAENTVALSDSKFKVAPLSVTVEIDGVAVGTAPGKIQVRPGFSKLRLTREGFKPFERTISPQEGQTLTIALEMSEAGYARWQDATAFVNGLKNGAKLTDAQAQVLAGHAKMLSESFYKVNTKENLQFILPGRR